MVENITKLTFIHPKSIWKYQQHFLHYVYYCKCALVGKSDGGQGGGHGLDGGQVDPERQWRQLAAVTAAVSAHPSRPRILPRHLRTSETSLIPTFPFCTYFYVGGDVEPILVLPELLRCLYFQDFTIELIHFNLNSGFILSYIIKRRRKVSRWVHLYWFLLCKVSLMSQVWVFPLRIWNHMKNCQNASTWLLRDAP